MEKKMKKQLAVSGIVSVSFALALMVGGCGNSDEKKEVHSKSETVTEHAVTEHGHETAATEHGHETAATEHGHEAAATEHGHGDTPDKVREAIAAAHEKAMKRNEQASEKVEEPTDTGAEHASEAHETVK